MEEDEARSEAIPKKTRVKKESIDLDLDLIRGSYFGKAKPQQSWLTTTYLGIVRTLFFPIYLNWWTEQTNPTICAIIFILYLLQMLSMYIYFYSEKDDFDEIPVSEVVSPLIMFFILGTMQSQIGKSNGKTKLNINSNSNSTPNPSTSSTINNNNNNNNTNNSTNSNTNNINSIANNHSVNHNNNLSSHSNNNNISNFNINHNNTSNDLNRIVNDYRDNAIDKIKRSHLINNNKIKCPSSLVKSSLSAHPRLKFRLPLSCSKSGDPCSSSGESECSLTPVSPITKLTTSDLDWPSINSDGCTSDEDGETIMGVEVTHSLRKLNEDRELFNFCEEPNSSALTNPYNPNNGNNNHHYHSTSHHHHHHHHHHHPQTHRNTHDDHHHHTPSVKYSQDDSSTNQRSGKPYNDKVSCSIWRMRECQKVDLSVMDISSSIVRKVESVKHSNEYFYLGFLLSLVLAFIPVIFRIRQLATSPRFSETRKSKLTPTPFSGSNSTKEISDIIQEIPTLATDLLQETMVHSFSSLGVQFVVLVAIVERFFLSLCFFFLLCVAERTFRERFLYAKYFCHLTSSRRARRSDLPHFRLNKVRNIKTWLSVRSYLQNHGPQRSIDAIVSSSFIVEVSILTFLCIQLLQDNEICSEKLYCWEMVFWNLAIGLYIMRLIILGSKMNRKSRGCLTILLSEQINLYLQLEQKPHKKEDLTLANQLIKSAADVLKLLEAPFKISGFSANPYLYNITKVIVLSAFSAVLTELLGFKLKLYKIKLTS